MTGLAALLDALERADGPADPVPSTDGWDLVLAENVGYLVDDQHRWQAFAALAQRVGTAPERILAAPDSPLLEVVVGMRRPERVQRLRRCAELAIAGAPWSAYPGIGRPGVERIDLFTGVRPVLALDANALRVLVRLGYGDAARAYTAAYRQAQAAASQELPEMVPARQRAHQLLRRHGMTTCRRSKPACPECPIAASCPAAGAPPPLY
jgi:adenine-specific DNA glycosylase